MAGFDDMAVIGMALRAPGAQSVEQFWSNLAQGKESVLPLSPAHLQAAGVSEQTLADPTYVAAGAVLEDPDTFDAGYFRMTPREARDSDPQIRMLLQTGHAALENAGYDPRDIGATVGVFASSGPNFYAQANPAFDPTLVGGVQLSAHTLNQSDYVATNLAYRLDLRGPSLTVLTACSSSLVAVHLAGQALRNGDCDLALVGASTLEFPVGQGYRYAPGGILSPDGHCRPFDHEAAGTVFGSGVIAVVLKMLDDADREGDRIRAVISATAVNNDGADKVSFGAPSLAGQAAVVLEAIELAGVDPADISYVEAHGTGTPIGDPIEVQALTEAFTTAHGAALPTGRCGLGSVKGNVGHLGPAAGLAGLVKTVLALEHEQLPPSINIDQPNPRIGLDQTPFAPVRELRPWPRVDGAPRYAGVSSLGIGGTNAHVVLREAPERARPRPDGRPRLVVWSGRTESACAQARDELSAWFTEAGEAEFADAVATLQHGRGAHPVRCAAVTTGSVDTTAALAAESGRVISTAGAGPMLLPDHLPGAAEVELLLDIVPGVRDFVDDWAKRSAEQTSGVAALGVALALADAWIGAGADPARIAGTGVGALAARVLGGTLSIEDAVAACADETAAPSRPADLTTHWTALAQLWTAGVDLDWSALGAPQPTQPAPVPGYPFARDRHWHAEVNGSEPRPDAGDHAGGDTGASGARLHAPTWREVSTEPAPPPSWKHALVIAAAETGPLPIGAALAGAGSSITRVAWSSGLSTDNPADEAFADALAARFARANDPVDLVVLAGRPAGSDPAGAVLAVLAAARTSEPAPLVVAVFDRAADVTGAEDLDTAAAAAGAAADVLLDPGHDPAPETLLATLGRLVAGSTLALRGTRCWLLDPNSPVPIGAFEPGLATLRPGGRQLVIDRGGAGALDLARAVAEAGMRVALTVVTDTDAAGRDEFDAVADLGADISLLPWSAVSVDGIDGLAGARVDGVIVIDTAATPDVVSALAAVRTVHAVTAAGPVDTALFVRAAPAPGDAVAAFWRCAARALGPRSARTVSVHIRAADAELGSRLLDLLERPTPDTVVLM